MLKVILLSFTHAAVGLAGFLAGIYLLPILAAPPAPDDALVRAAAEAAQFRGEFRRDLEDSDALHWGEGTVSIGRDVISLQGEIAPGPAYKLYLSPQFVETETAFLRLKDRMVQVGDVKTFKNFMVTVPRSVDPAAFNTVIIWCESFNEFITAAQYR